MYLHTYAHEYTHMHSIHKKAQLTSVYYVLYSHHL